MKNQLNLYLDIDVIATLKLLAALDTNCMSRVVEKLVKKLIKDRYVQERVKSIS